MPIIDKVLVNEQDFNNPGRVSIPPRMLISDYIEQNIRKNIEEYGDSTCLFDISTDRSMSYSQLLLNIKSFAGSLHEKGMRTGDKVLVMSSNFIEVPFVLIGVWKAAGSIVSLADNLQMSNFGTTVKEMRPKFIIADETCLDRIRNNVRDLDFIQEIFVIGKADGYTSVEDLLLGKTSAEYSESVDVETNEIWLMYTSGTTGTPKGIFHTHMSLIGNVEISREYHKMNGKKLLYTNTMSHFGGTSVLLAKFLLHANVCFSSKFSEFDLLKIIDRIKPFAVNVFPHQIAWICRQQELDKYDLTSVVSLFTLGSTINSTYERELFDKFPNLLFLNNFYGTTETGAICSNRPMPDEIIGIDKTIAIERHVIGSCGKILPLRKLKIIDRETGEKLGPGEVGEICIQTSIMMKEYRNLPEETAQFVRDGWCHLGDRGYYDNNENVFVLNRFKELMKYKMMHVLPTHIEGVMMKHPAVEDVAVVGLPHEIDGEHPLAFVVSRTGMSVAPQELIDFTNEKVLDEEKLRGGVRFIDKIPRNKLGKIVRPELLKLL